MLGDVVSTSSRFSYVTEVKKETLTANFRFNPNSPSEPDEPIVRHRVKMECSEGGNFSGTSGLVLTGNSVSLRANANSGYEFLGWYMNGEFYTALPDFTFTMGDVNADDEVNITDVAGALSIIKGKDDMLIQVVADPNEDGEVNITDIVGILEIIKK